MYEWVNYATETALGDLDGIADDATFKIHLGSNIYWCHQQTLGLLVGLENKNSVE